MRAFQLFGAALAGGSLITPGLAVPNKFYSSRQACPQACSALGDETSNWTVYTWVDRLKACNETMLLNFNIYNSLDNPKSSVKISACVADSDTTLRKRNDLNSTLATSNSTTQAAATTNATVEILSVGSGNSTSTANVVDAVTKLQNFIANGPATEKIIRFAFSGGAVVGVYSGMHIDSTSTNSLLQDLGDRITAGETADITAMQVCGDDRNANNVLGVIADTTGSGLSSVQEIIASWSNATCVDLGSDAIVTSSSISIAGTPTLKQRDTAHAVLSSPKRSTTCSTVRVVSGDSCSSLVGNSYIENNAFLLTSINRQPNVVSPAPNSRNITMTILYALPWQSGNTSVVQKANCPICRLLLMRTEPVIPIWCNLVIPA